MGYKAGDRVRLRGDPVRVGVITGQTRPRLQLTYYQVSFPDGSNYVPEDQLEPLTEGGNDPITDLEQGRLASCADLRRSDGVFGKVDTRHLESVKRFSIHGFVSFWWLTAQETAAIYTRPGRS